MNKFTHLQEWFRLPDETKIRLFTETSRQIGLPSSSAAEKDWWVVHTLSVIFSMECTNTITFKGGTSLSKGWNIIHRFSEDIDLALDREFLGFQGELTKGDIKKLRRKSFQFITEVFDKIRVERLSRHLYDIEKLSQTEYAEIALQDTELYNTIVTHRSKFTAISGIDYTKHNPVNIKFVPPDTIIKKWEADYDEMKGSMIYGQPLNFNELIKRLTKLQKRINASF